MNLRPRALAAICGVVLMLCVSGCTESPESNFTADPLVGLLEQATAAEVSAEQIAVLSSGSITYAQYESAFELMFTCMEDGGVQVNRNGTVSRAGVTQLDYTFQIPPGSTMSDEQGVGIADGCHQHHAMFIDIYWQTMQPEVLAYEQRRAEALWDTLAQCLISEGIEVDEAQSFTDLIVQSSLLGESRDCLGEIGYDTWAG